jgi:hypothetical protein
MADEPFVVIIPIYGDPSEITMMSIQMAQRAGVPFLYYPKSGDALIGRSRSIACTEFMERFNTQWMVFIDADIVFEPSDLYTIYQDLKDGYDLIGGVYVVAGGKFFAHHARPPIDLDNQIHQIGNGYLSTGFTGISKRLLERMVKELELPLCHPTSDLFKCYPFFESGAYQYEGQWIYRSEDWDFCDKARQLGVSPYLDTRIRVGHRKYKVYTVDDLPKDVATPSNGKSKIILPTPKEVSRAILRGNPVIQRAR